ncbi:MAG: MOFRL family protein [Rhodocyclaceae bacterium]
MQRPCVILSGGETTVTVRGQGRGGRAAERRLASADFLARNDGYCFFAALNRLIVTGPTRTN